MYVVIAQQLEIYYRRCVGSGGIFVFKEKTNEKKDSTLQLTVVVSCATVEFILLLCDGEKYAV